METKYTLRLKEFESNIGDVWKHLQKETEFHDVTLASEDIQIRAHKLVLSSCSPVLEKFLKQNFNQNPLIFLPGVKSTHLMHIVDFIYQGEVRIEEAQLEQFMSLARDLKIKGLIEENKQQNDTSFDKQKPELYEQKDKLNGLKIDTNVDPITKSPDLGVRINSLVDNYKDSIPNDIPFNETFQSNGSLAGLESGVNGPSFHQDLINDKASKSRAFNKTEVNSFQPNERQAGLKSVVMGTQFQPDLTKDVVSKSRTFNQNELNAFQPNERQAGLNGAVNGAPFQKDLINDVASKILPEHTISKLSYHKEKSESFVHSDNYVGFNGAMKEEPIEETPDLFPSYTMYEHESMEEDGRIADVKASDVRQEEPISNKSILENDMKKDAYYQEPQIMQEQDKQETNYSIAEFEKNHRFHCGLCDKSFSNHSNMTEHKRRKHDGLRFYCEQCDFKAVRKGVLRKHENNVHGHLKYVA